MARAREHPYVWATWIARLLAGEAHCEWASWFRAHYQDWARDLRPTSTRARWMMDHTDLVNQARESRKKLGYTVSHRGPEFSFRLRGKFADPGGETRPHRRQETGTQ